MGNVLAASKPLSSAANSFLANPNASPSALDDEENVRKRIEEPLENPGTMEELHKKCKGKFFFTFFFTFEWSALNPRAANGYVNIL